MESTHPLCLHHCALHRFCIAINYKKHVDEKRPNCQLTNTTKPKFEENAQEKDKIWTFQKVVVDRRELVGISTILHLLRVCLYRIITN